MPIQPVKPSTSTTSHKLGSHSAASVSNTTRRGMAKTVSVIAISTRSIQPPPSAAEIPTVQPTKTETATDRIPTVNEILAPYIKRERMSRPKRSVPSQ